MEVPALKPMRRAFRMAHTLVPSLPPGRAVSLVLNGDFDSVTLKKIEWGRCHVGGVLIG